MEKYDKKFWAKFDRTPDTFAAAAKQPWECQTYQEWLASLDDADTPPDGDCDE